MNIDQAIDKAKKLLALATSDNVNEAAAAAKQAQAILARFEISQAMLEIEGEAERPDEPIADSRAAGDDPLERGRALASYRKVLVGVLADVNGCTVYRRRERGKANELHIIGRRSDVAKVRYLYPYLCREIERLTERDGRGATRTWRNNFRIGAAETICRALESARDEAAAELRRTAGSDARALVRVDKALAELRRRDRELAAWIRANMHLRGGGSCSFRGDNDGREAGRRAGREVNLGGARGELGTGQRRIGGRHG